MSVVLIAWLTRCL